MGRQDQRSNPLRSEHRWYLDPPGLREPMREMWIAARHYDARVRRHGLPLAMVSDLQRERIEKAHVVVGKFEPVVGRGLASVLRDHPAVCVLRAGLERRELLRTLAHLAPDVAIVPRPPDSAALARLVSASSHTAIMVYVYCPKRSYAELLTRVGIHCVSYSISEPDLIAAVQRVAREHHTGAGDRSHANRSTITTLTGREMEVLELLLAAEQLTLREIAARLRITPETVRTHAANIRRKLHIERRYPFTHSESAPTP